jgi:hypothetical protein
MWFKRLLYKLAPRNWHNVRYIFGPNIGCAYYDWHVRICQEIANWHLNQARSLDRDFDRELSDLRREHREMQRMASLKPIFRMEGGTEG